MSDFYDAIAENLGKLSHGDSVLSYFDGFFAATEEQLAVFARHRWITVTGSSFAGAGDWLPDNNFDLARYVHNRTQSGEHRARVYVPRAFARQALGVLGYPRAGGLWSRPNVVWWIPTLDDGDWTPDTLAASLRSFDAPIPAGKLWGNQYTQLPRLHAPGAYADVSRLWLPW